ncbi:MAG: ferredoxin-type protein NapF [Vibrio sp.]
MSFWSRKKQQNKQTESKATDEPNLSRRALFTGAAAKAESLAISPSSLRHTAEASTSTASAESSHTASFSERLKTAINKEEPVKRTIPRPPYAVDEDIFTRLCNQCGKCETACPESIIRMENGFPTLDVEYSHCTLCGKCQTACPTIALSHTKPDTGLRAKVADTCINIYGHCDSCANSCPSDALIWQDNAAPKINNDQCSGCGICKSDCFIGAIQMG